MNEIDRGRPIDVRNEHIKGRECPKIDGEERFPDPAIHCPHHGSEDHHPPACRIEISEDIHWSHMAGHNALAWTDGWYSYNSSNRYYIRALIVDSEQKRYHAERVLADKDSRAWWIFSRLCEIKGWKVLGDTLVLKTRDNDEDYGWNSVHRMDDWKMFDQMITEW